MSGCMDGYMVEGSMDVRCMRALMGDGCIDDVWLHACVRQFADKAKQLVL